ncbi:MAG: SRPBCC family protein [Nitrospiraceae bacterium]|nr:SRPBCC family protein [Nitrospiraceae bacterium]
MAHLKKSILINAPLDKVYTLARDPKRWASWWVGLSEPEKITGDGGAGTVVEQSYLLMGLRFPVPTRVLEDRIGPEGAFWKCKMEGPLAGEQTWTFIPKGNDTEVTAEMEYTVPGKLLGKIADRLIIERMMERNIGNTLENLKMLSVGEPVHV